MKRLQAFLVAIFLFAVCITGIHVASNRISFNDDTGQFNRWYSSYKDKYAEALENNIDPDTMLVFGSSEFGHLRKNRYYFANMFSVKDMDVQIIGQPYSQCLNHAITLGALALYVKNKKVVLVLSPSWFEGKGADDFAFQSRFSDSLYTDFLNNKNISDDIKKKVAERVNELTASDNSQWKRVNLYNKVYLDKDDSLLSGIACRITDMYSDDKENAALRMALLKKKIGVKVKNKKNPPIKDIDGNPNWAKLWKSADRRTAGKSTNCMGMDDEKWNSKFRYLYNTSEGFHRHTSMTVSKEYDDLELFLSICREEGIQVKLINQTVNGYWYDYTGLSKKTSDGYRKKIRKIAAEYGAELEDFSGFDYEPRVETDAVHPWEKGWLLLDEGIYSFYKNQKPLM